jgi:hypothetical protein
MLTNGQVLPTLQTGESLTVDLSTPGKVLIKGANSTATVVTPDVASDAVRLRCTSRIIVLVHTCSTEQYSFLGSLHLICMICVSIISSCLHVCCLDTAARRFRLAQISLHLCGGTCLLTRLHGQTAYLSPCSWRI